MARFAILNLRVSDLRLDSVYRLVERKYSLRDARIAGRRIGDQVSRDLANL